MSTEKSRTSKTEDRRYADICGATNNRGDPCKLPAGWGTPGSGGTRCRYHGGCSTGPDDVSHLEANDFAEGNPGGCPPENNSNAAIHLGFSNWETAYERFQSDQDARDRIDLLERSYLETAREHADDLDDARRKELAREHADDLDDARRKELARELATRRLLKSRASNDVWNDGDSDARGLLLEDGDGSQKVNPAHTAAHQHKKRTREIAEELSLWSGFR